MCMPKVVDTVNVQGLRWQRQSTCQRRGDGDAGSELGLSDLESFDEEHTSILETEKNFSAPQATAAVKVPSFHFTLEAPLDNSKM